MEKKGFVKTNLLPPRLQVFIVEVFPTLRGAENRILLPDLILSHKREVYLGLTKKSSPIAT